MPYDSEGKRLRLHGISDALNGDGLLSEPRTHISHSTLKASLIVNLVFGQGVALGSTQAIMHNGAYLLRYLIKATLAQVMSHTFIECRFPRRAQKVSDGGRLYGDSCYPASPLKT